MRLRLVHTLSLTLLAFAAIAVLALGGLTAWNLRHGFGSYLAARDVAHLERFVGVVESVAARAGGLAALPPGRQGMRMILDELNPIPEGLPGRGPRPPPGVSPPAGWGVAPPPPVPAEAGDAVPPPRGPGPGGRPPGPRPFAGPVPFPERVQVVDLDGRLVLGVPLQSGTAAADPVVERRVRIDGRDVGLARMRVAPPLLQDGETGFLRDQYRVIAVGSAALLAVALLTAALLARRWTRPLAAVQDATQRLARGELTVRVPAGPALADRTDEIGDVVRNVNRMAEGLERLEGTRRRWLADISHELRTPLTVLRGDIEALRDGVRPMGLPAVAVLHEEVLRLGKLVDDLHLLAISDLQALPCHFEPVGVDDLLQRLLRRFRGRAEAAGLTLDADLPRSLATLSAEWDADRIEQLLGNLIENSLRYTDAPGRIRLGLRQQDDTVEVVVEDSAPGVDADRMSQLFEPLFRVDAARARQHGGSGLGLAICRAIARAHGGTLSADPSALGGLRVTLRLPRCAPGAPDRSPELDR